MQLDFFRQLTVILRTPVLTTTPAPQADPQPPVPAAQRPPAAKRIVLRSGRDPELEAKARELLLGIGCAPLAELVRVIWNPRMRSTAGTAMATRSLITLNSRLREFGEAEIDRTFRHELAHLLAHHRVGRRRIEPHGVEWQRACRDLGLPDEKRCHDLPLPRRTQRVRYLYRCPGCQVEVPRVRPLKPKSACLACCKRHNHGKYDERFRFQKLPPPA